jgi:hypothetical protein
MTAERQRSEVGDRRSEKPDDRLRNSREWRVRIKTVWSLESGVWSAKTRKSQMTDDGGQMTAKGQMTDVQMADDSERPTDLLA